MRPEKPQYGRYMLDHWMTPKGNCFTFYDSIFQNIFLFRMEGTFNDEARHRLRMTQESEEFNTWLTMVSIVGKTGVGKSTVASLLSGNDTMFKADSTSSGVTTLGADISTIILSYQYKTVLEPLLANGSLYHPDISRPLFLIDSEGMSFRGEEVDFVTTSLWQSLPTLKSG